MCFIKLSLLFAQKINENQINPSRIYDHVQKIYEQKNNKRYLKIRTKEQPSAEIE
jgi:hypothetical protein